MEFTQQIAVNESLWVCILKVSASNYSAFTFYGFFMSLYAIPLNSAYWLPKFLYSRGH
jgi:hypothetical protein